MFYCCNTRWKCCFGVHNLTVSFSHAVSKWVAASIWRECAFTRDNTSRVHHMSSSHCNSLCKQVTRCQTGGCIPLRESVSPHCRCRTPLKELRWWAFPVEEFTTVYIKVYDLSFPPQDPISSSRNFVIINVFLFLFIFLFCPCVGPFVTFWRMQVSFKFLLSGPFAGSLKQLP